MNERMSMSWEWLVIIERRRKNDGFRFSSSSSSSSSSFSFLFSIISQLCLWMKCAHIGRVRGGDRSFPLFTYVYLRHLRFDQFSNDLSESRLIRSRRLRHSTFDDPCPCIFSIDQHWSLEQRRRFDHWHNNISCLFSSFSLSLFAFPPLLFLSD